MPPFLQSCALSDILTVQRVVMHTMFFKNLNYKNDELLFETTLYLLISLTAVRKDKQYYLQHINYCPYSYLYIMNTNISWIETSKYYRMIYILLPKCLLELFIQSKYNIYPIVSQWYMSMRKIHKLSQKFDFKHLIRTTDVILSEFYRSEIVRFTQELQLCDYFWSCSIVFLSINIRDQVFAVHDDIYSKKDEAGLKIIDRNASYRDHHCLVTERTGESKK